MLCRLSSIEGRDQIPNVAAAKGRPRVTEAVLELPPEVAEEFLQWFVER